MGMALDGGGPIPEEPGSSKDPPKKVQRSSIHVEHKDSGCRGVTGVKHTTIAFRLDESLTFEVAKLPK